MSGGKDPHKSRGKNAPGWEEAGSEFYQESFPTDIDSAIQRDPAAIATLLPSKQNRAGRSYSQFKKSTMTRICTNYLYMFVVINMVNHSI